MKTKIIIFFLLFPIFEIIAVVCTFMMQALFDIKKNNVDETYINILAQYIFNPVDGIVACIDGKNPFILILPVLFLILLIYSLTQKTKITSQIDDKSSIYGTANWESVDKLTKKNILGKSKFCTFTKKYFLKQILESIEHGGQKE